MEHCYKHIMICLHGGIVSHFDESKEEIIPFIKENKLNSLQLLAVPPRNCVNLVNNDILTAIDRSLFLILNVPDCHLKF